MGKCYFLCTISSKRLDAELIRRGHDIRHKRYPIGYQEAPLAYDAVWSVALAFNRTMERLARKDKKRSLKDFTYTDAEIAGEIYASMNSTSFLGVSVSSNQQEQTVSTLLILFRAHGKEAKLLLKYFPPPPSTFHCYYLYALKYINIFYDILWNLFMRRLPSRRLIYMCIKLNFLTFFHFFLSVALVRLCYRVL